MVDQIQLHIQRSQVSLEFCLEKFGIKKSTYYGWFDDSGILKDIKPRSPVNDRKVLPEEISAVLEYRKSHPDIGYRKLCWQMVDENVVCLSETAVYNILSAHNMLNGWSRLDLDPAEKEYRYKPRAPHHHWHTDIAYIKIQGVFYFLIMVLDGYSRMLLGWELMTDMLGSSVELFINRVKEKYPHAKPKLIHDNGSQFISLEFVRLLQKLEIQQVRTRRNHPQTNGKIERMNGVTKSEAIRPNAPNSYQEAFEILNSWEYEYNYHRLHAGIKYLRPADMFFGRSEKVLSQRSERIEIARLNRKQKNQTVMRTQENLH